MMGTFFRFSNPILVLLLSVTLFAGCEEENMAPTFESFSPSDNYSCEKGEIVPFYFEAVDEDGTIEEIWLTIDGKMVESVFSDYISYEWDTENASVGTHEVIATAVDNQGQKGTKTLNIIIDPIILSAPENLIIGEYEEMLSISWDAVSKAKSYTLYWTNDGSEPDENSQKIEDIEVTIHNHDDLDFTKTYTYKVQAVNGEFTSPLSQSASGTPQIPLLDPPANVTAEVVDGKIRITWDPVDFEGVVYTIERKSPAVDFYYKTIAEDISETTYTDATNEPGKGYFYIVSASENTYDRTSEDSDPAYAVTMKTVYENERNNENASTTLLYDTHYYDAEETTEELDWFRVKGSYSGAYSIYSAYSYRNFDADCFLIYLEDGDGIQFDMISGNMSGIYSMSVSVIEYGKYTTGNDREVLCHEYSYTSGYFKYNKSNTGTVYGTYLKISMWEDLVNYGPYNYEVEIKIFREP